MNYSFKSTAGYSLTEVMGVVAVVLILAAIAIAGVAMTRCGMQETALKKEIQQVTSAYQNYIAAGGPQFETKEEIYAAITSTYNGIGPFLVSQNASPTFLTDDIALDAGKIRISDSWSCLGGASASPTPSPTPAGPTPTPSATPNALAITVTPAQTSFLASSSNELSIALTPTGGIALTGVTVSMPYPSAYSAIGATADNIANMLASFGAASYADIAKDAGFVVPPTMASEGDVLVIAQLMGMGSAQEYWQWSWGYDTVEDVLANEYGPGDTVADVYADEVNFLGGRPDLGIPGNAEWVAVAPGDESALLADWGVGSFEEAANLWYSTAPVGDFAWTGDVPEGGTTITVPFTATQPLGWGGATTGTFTPVATSSTGSVSASCTVACYVDGQEFVMIGSFQPDVIPVGGTSQYVVEVISTSGAPVPAELWTWFSAELTPSYGADMGWHQVWTGDTAYTATISVTGSTVGTFSAAGGTAATNFTESTLTISGSLPTPTPTPTPGPATLSLSTSGIPNDVPVTLSGAGTFTTGAVVPVSAPAYVVENDVNSTPINYYLFSSWTQGGSTLATASDTSVTLSEDTSLVANYTLQPGLTVNLSSITVTSGQRLFTTDIDWYSGQDNEFGSATASLATSASIVENTWIQVYWGDVGDTSQPLGECWSRDSWGDINSTSGSPPVNMGAYPSMTPSDYGPGTPSTVQLPIWARAVHELDTGNGGTVIQEGRSSQAYLTVIAPPALTLGSVGATTGDVGDPWVNSWPSPSEILGAVEYVFHAPLDPTTPMTNDGYYLSVGASTYDGGPSALISPQAPSIVATYIDGIEYTSGQVPAGDHSYDIEYVDSIGRTYIFHKHISMD